VFVALSVVQTLYAPCSILDVPGPLDSTTNCVRKSRVYAAKCSVSSAIRHNGALQYISSEELRRGGQFWRNTAAGLSVACSKNIDDRAARAACTSALAHAPRGQCHATAAWRGASRGWDVIGAEAGVVRCTGTCQGCGLCIIRTIGTRASHRVAAAAA
jgi:hypothetical protein